MEAFTVSRTRKRRRRSERPSLARPANRHRLRYIMKSIRCIRWLVIALLIAAGHGTLCAQEAVRKIVLPSLDSQVAARLIALEKRLNPIQAPERAASLVAGLAL